MNQTKEKRYKMAYVELNEIIKHLSEDEQLKIPRHLKKIYSKKWIKNINLSLITKKVF